ncbi:hypothetical protein [uncultured Bradyrhizobium sp.]|jgi:hypothetical protein|uniref:hypothetical protein n=1 Tax=uncultured Bradyrhizobium sp. TaxID=199684 RepID=UPI00261DC1F4|nr:hypothetical protein [uncultured Bradyrhizobium sp.]
MDDREDDLSLWDALLHYCGLTESMGLSDQVGADGRRRTLGERTRSPQACWDELCGLLHDGRLKLSVIRDPGDPTRTEIEGRVACELLLLDADRGKLKSPTGSILYDARVARTSTSFEQPPAGSSAAQFYGFLHNRLQGRLLVDDVQVEELAGKLLAAQQSGDKRAAAALDDELQTRKVQVSAIHEILRALQEEFKLAVESGALELHEWGQKAGAKPTHDYDLPIDRVLVSLVPKSAWPTRGGLAARVAREFEGLTRKHAPDGVPEIKSILKHIQGHRPALYEVFKPPGA